MSESVVSFINIEDCIYTSCYCEENIWKLCEKIKTVNSDSLGNCYVIFVSNHSKKVPIWYQKVGEKNEEHLVIWDYHVFMVEKTSNGSLVFDFDTVLRFPESFENYVQKALKPEFNPSYKRLFRVIPSNLYLSNFASDRSHMKKPNGSYIKEPPTYPPIANGVSLNNLHEFVSMRKNIGVGDVMELEAFYNLFNS